jgi:hypothetical protein
MIGPCQSREAPATPAGSTKATAPGNVLIQARASDDIGSLSQIRDVVRYSSSTRWRPSRRKISGPGTLSTSGSSGYCAKA